MGGDHQCPGVRLYLGSLGLLTQMSLAEAQSFGLLDPKLCYLLDGLLFIYGVIITALFLRTKVSGEGSDLKTQGRAGTSRMHTPGTGKRACTRTYRMESGKGVHCSSVG